MTPTVAEARVSAQRQKFLNDPNYSHEKSHSRLTATPCSWQPGAVDVLLIIQVYKSTSADFRGTQIAGSGPIMQQKTKNPQPQGTAVVFFFLNKTIMNVMNILR